MFPTLSNKQQEKTAIAGIHKHKTKKKKYLNNVDLQCF